MALRRNISMRRWRYAMYSNELIDLDHNNVAVCDPFAHGIAVLLVDNRHSTAPALRDFFL
ncbi:hypothetical protein WCU73_11605 [Pectobacterium brasiliense]|uniref:hypothetical protein n=1 Tax=Pectobacterium brasiliense TaxID=180957 RepID=UPI00301AF919